MAIQAVHGSFSKEIQEDLLSNGIHISHNDYHMLFIEKGASDDEIQISKGVSKLLGNLVTGVNYVYEPFYFFVLNEGNYWLITKWYYPDYEKVQSWGGRRTRWAHSVILTEKELKEKYNSNFNCIIDQLSPESIIEYAKKQSFPSITPKTHNFSNISQHSDEFRENSHILKEMWSSKSEQIQLSPIVNESYPKLIHDFYYFSPPKYKLRLRSFAGLINKSEANVNPFSFSVNHSKNKNEGLSGVFLEEVEKDFTDLITILSNNDTTGLLKFLRSEEDIIRDEERRRQEQKRKEEERKRVEEAEQRKIAEAKIKTEKEAEELRQKQEREHNQKVDKETIKETYREDSDGKKNSYPKSGKSTQPLSEQRSQKENEEFYKPTYQQEEPKRNLNFLYGGIILIIGIGIGALLFSSVKENNEPTTTTTSNKDSTQVAPSRIDSTGLGRFQDSTDTGLSVEVEKIIKEVMVKPELNEKKVNKSVSKQPEKVTTAKVKGDNKETVGLVNDDSTEKQ